MLKHLLKQCLLQFVGVLSFYIWKDIVTFLFIKPIYFYSAVSSFQTAEICFP